MITARIVTKCKGYCFVDVSGYERGVFVHYRVCEPPLHLDADTRVGDLLEVDDIVITDKGPRANVARFPR